MKKKYRKRRVKTGGYWIEIEENRIANEQWAKRTLSKNPSHHPWIGTSIKQKKLYENDFIEPEDP